MNNFKAERSERRQIRSAFSPYYLLILIFKRHDGWARYWLVFILLEKVIEALHYRIHSRLEINLKYQYQSIYGTPHFTTLHFTAIHSLTSSFSVLFFSTQCYFAFSHSIFALVCPQYSIVPIVQCCSYRGNVFTTGTTLTSNNGNVKQQHQCMSNGNIKVNMK